METFYSEYREQVYQISSLYHRVHGPLIFEFKSPLLVGTFTHKLNDLAFSHRNVPVWRCVFDTTKNFSRELEAASPRLQKYSKMYRHRRTVNHTNIHNALLYYYDIPQNHSIYSAQHLIMPSIYLIEVKLEFSTDRI